MSTPLSSLSCPLCNSRHIVTLDYGRKTGAAVGATAGAAGSVAAALGGAEAGAALGMVAGPVGSLFGGLAGALMGALPKWYWWRLKHWGCKWEPRQIKLVGDDAMRIQLNFETANTPPIPIVRALCEQLPNLDVELLYLELGNELAGYVSNIDGDIEEYEIYDSLEYPAPLRGQPAS